LAAAALDMTVADRIRRKLTARFAPLVLEIEDESQRHAGHPGARMGGETHFRVRIVAKAFEGLSRQASQRLIYEALAEELSGPVHALSVSAKAPSESQR
jgi:BolA protein